jgi:hypothetical protein
MNLSRYVELISQKLVQSANWGTNKHRFSTEKGKNWREMAKYLFHSAPSFKDHFSFWFRILIKTMEWAARNGDDIWGSGGRGKMTFDSLWIWSQKQGGIQIQPQYPGNLPLYWAIGQFEAHKINIPPKSINQHGFRGILRQSLLKIKKLIISKFCDN